MSARERTVVFAAVIASLLSIAISSAPAKEAPAPGPAEENSLFGQTVVPGEVIVRFERGSIELRPRGGEGRRGCHPRAQAPAAPHRTGAGGAWPGAGGRLEARARLERRVRGTEPGRSCRRHAQRHPLHKSLGPQQHRADGRTAPPAWPMPTSTARRAGTWARASGPRCVWPSWTAGSPEPTPTSPPTCSSTPARAGAARRPTASTTTATARSTTSAAGTSSTTTTTRPTTTGTARTWPARSRRAPTTASASRALRASQPPPETGLGPRSWR